MARTDSGAVQGVLLKDYDSRLAPSLAPFIEAAGSVVDDVATCATGRGKTLTAAKLELLERWLAAHFYSMSDQPYASKNTERAGARYQGQTGMYLEASKYGQMAVTLDTSGCLATIASGMRKTAGGFWLGKNERDQIDVEDRS